MPYDRKSELPKQVKNNVPKHGQEIYRKAYNNAYDQYKGDEARASRVAWAAVKTKYEKGADEKWHRARS
ncbi:MAG: ChaB family protein [Candidatus Andersenbacteria bacterium]